LLGVAFFSSSEAAILSVSRIRVRNLAEKRDRRALALQTLKDSHDSLLGTILLLENFLIIIASSLWTVMAAGWLEARHLATPAGLLGASLVMTFLIVAFGEIGPKTFGATHAERYSLAVALPMKGIVWLASPVVRGFTLITNGLIKLTSRALRIASIPHSPFVTDDEIKMLVDVGQEEGTIEAGEHEMIHGVLDLGDTTARSIMVPRIDMVCIPAGTTLEEAIGTALESGHSRIPVFRDTSDNIVGILYVKDLLSLVTKKDRPHHLPTSYVRPATYIPESKRVDDLLTEMRRMKIHLAVVMDEYGGTAGLVTIEDILEEIVGEIQDEYDPEEALAVQHQPDGSLVVDGKVPIDEVNELLDVELPTEEFDTIGGFVVGQLGRAPNQGEEVRYNTLRLVARDVEARRLVRVHIFRDNASREADN
jgi:CBS domain containing-hemolysin-like protein